MVQTEWEDAIHRTLAESEGRARWARNAALMIRFARLGGEVDRPFAGWLAAQGMRRSGQSLPAALSLGWTVVTHLRQLQRLAERQAANGGPTGPGLHIGRELHPFDVVCHRLLQRADCDRIEVEHRLWRARPLRRRRARGAAAGGRA